MNLRDKTVNYPAKNSFMIKFTVAANQLAGSTCPSPGNPYRSAAIA